MRGLVRFIVCPLAVAGGVLSTPALATPLFDFTEVVTVAESHGSIPIRAFGMSGNGDVAYILVNSTPGNTTPYSVKKWSNGATTTIANGLTDIKYDGVGINDHGSVAFGTFSNGVYTGNGGPLTQISPDWVYSGFDINNAGQVGATNINNSTLNIIGPSSRSAPISISIAGEAAINNNGTTAALTQSNGSFGTIYTLEPDGRLEQFNLPPSLHSGSSQLGINDLGNISLMAYGSTVNEIIGLVNSNGLVPLVEFSDGFNGFGGNTSINNNNQVAFRGINSVTGVLDGLYFVDPSGDAPVKVIQGGDTIAGRDVMSVGFQNGQALFTSALNDTSLAFVARTRDPMTNTQYHTLYRADARPGVFPGNPILPEPGAELPGGGWTVIAPGDNALRRWFDPEYAVGYDISLASSDAPSFESILIPIPLPGGDAEFEVLLGGDVYQLLAGVVFDFTDIQTEGVREFTIQGIDLAEELDPSDFTAFVFGATFLDDGNGEDFPFHMVPIVMNTDSMASNAVPEPTSLILFGIGLAGLGVLRGRRQHPLRIREPL